jgi:hypothetical protein
MRRSHLFVLFVCLGASLDTVTPARADHLPAVIIPGRPDVPVIIYNRDASYAVIEGEWGLTRPGAVYPEIYGAHPRPHYGHNRGFFPMTGRTPVRGRQEVIPPANRPLPPQAQPFFREWGTQSPAEFGSADVAAGPNDPSVIVGPGFPAAEPWRRWDRRRPVDRNPRRWHPRTRR